MQHLLSPFTIWQLDPGAFTPFYERLLCAALIEQDQPVLVRFLTTRSLYETPGSLPAFEEHFYFPLLQRFHFLNRPEKLRKIVRGLHYLVDQGRLTVQILQHRPQIVHVQWALLPHYDSWLWDRWKRLGARIVLTVHDLVPLNMPPEAAARYFRLYDHADALILHSERNRADLAEWVGRVLPERQASLLAKVRVIPMGIFYEKSSPRSPTEARRRFGLNPDALTLLYFGVIKEYKGIPVLLEAYRSLLRQMPSVQLFIVGYVSPTFPGGEEGLRASVSNLPGVFLDLRYVPDADVADYFASADCAVLPYIQGTQSAVAFTSLAQGCPIIASNIGGLSDVVIPDETGLLVEPGDVSALAEAMLRLLREPALRQHMSTRAKQIAQERFGWQPIAAQTLALYHELAHEKSTSA